MIFTCRQKTLKRSIFPLRIETMKKIDTKKNMAQLIREIPQLAQILSQKGIDCAECMASGVDTLEDVARMYKLNLNQLMEQLDTGKIVTHQT